MTALEETIRQVLEKLDGGKYRGQCIAVENEIVETCHDANAQNLKQVAKVVAERVASGQLEIGPDYTRAHQSLQKKFWDLELGFVGIVDKLNQECIDKGWVPITADHLEMALQSIRKSGFGIPRSERFYAEQKRIKTDRKWRAEATAQGQEAVNLEKELLADYKESLESSRSQQEHRTGYTRKMDQIIVDLLVKESARLAAMTLPELRAQKVQKLAQREAEKTDKLNLSDMRLSDLTKIAGFNRAPIQRYKPLPPEGYVPPGKVRPIPWRVSTLKRMSRSELNTCIRVYGEDAINAACQAAFARGEE